MEFTVTDIKQYVYCPRIIYYTYVMPVAKKLTFKMELSNSQHVHFDALEARRTLSKYGLENGKRHHGMWMRSSDLGLSGRVDLLIETDDACYPVEYKYTFREPFTNHKYQLTAYAALAQAQFKKPTPCGYVYRIPDKQLFAIEITDKAHRFITLVLSAIRKIVHDEHYPLQPRSQARCRECEYRRHCY